MASRLTRNLRLDERYKKTPVVALTAHASVEDRKLAKATGFDAFLGKPIDRDDLFRTPRFIGALIAASPRPNPSLQVVESDRVVGQDVALRDLG